VVTVEMGILFSEFRSKSETLSHWRSFLRLIRLALNRILMPNTFMKMFLILGIVLML
jgi:hypothetical protein